MPLSKSELENFLKVPRLAHLGIASGKGKPRVNPMWYAYEDGVFYFTTRLGRFKGRLLKENPNIALSIASEEIPYVAVCGFGKAEVLRKNIDELLKKVAFRYGEEDGKRWFAKVTKQPDRVILRLKPDRVLSWHYGRGDSEKQDEGESMATET